MQNKTLAIFSFTSCQGCQMSILNHERTLLEILDKFKIVHFPLMNKKPMAEPCDLALVEGAITQKSQIEEIRDIRNNTSFLIAMGTCAVNGGIRSIKNFEKNIKVTKKEQKNPRYQNVVNAEGIDKYVQVDYYMGGCPINAKEFIYVIKQIMISKKPDVFEFPVCSECLERENECLLNKGEFCMGPITQGGCNAICPSIGIPCNGCNGPMDDTNIPTLIDLLRKKGIKKDELRRFLIKYSGNRLHKYLENGKK